MSSKKHDLHAIDEEEQFRLAIEQSMKESNPKHLNGSLKKAQHNQFDQYEDVLGNSYGNKGLNDSFGKSKKKNLY